MLQVEDEEFDDSHLCPLHPVVRDDMDSDLSDADSTQDEENDTEVEEAGDSDEDDDEDSLESLEDTEEVSLCVDARRYVHVFQKRLLSKSYIEFPQENLDDNGADDSFTIDLHSARDTSGTEDIGMSYMEEDENDDEDGENELELEYDFEDDIGDELDYFVNMPWGTRKSTVFLIHAVFVKGKHCLIHYVILMLHISQFYGKTHSSGNEFLQCPAPVFVLCIL